MPAKLPQGLLQGTQITSAQWIIFTTHQDDRHAAYGLLRSRAKRQAHCRRPEKSDQFPTPHTRLEGLLESASLIGRLGSSAFRLSQRRACALVGLHPRTYRDASTRPDDSVLRAKLWELTSQRRRFGYRRLGLMLERQGIKLNAKKLYRLYKEERLTVRKRGGRKRALGTRAPMTIPQDRNLRWSLDFVADALVSGRRFRILTLVDDFTRECLGLVVDTSLTGFARCPRTRSDRRTTQLSMHDRQRQRHRADLKRHSRLAAGTRRRVALYCAGQTDAEWVYRKLQRPTARRVSERTLVHQPQGGAPDHRRMEDRLQHQPTALEPQGAHTD